MENLRLYSLRGKLITRVGLKIKNNTDTPFPTNYIFLIQDVTLHIRNPVTMPGRHKSTILALMPSHHEGLLTTVTMTVNMFYFLLLFLAVVLYHIKEK